MRIYIYRYIYIFILTDDEPFVGLFLLIHKELQRYTLITLWSNLMYK